MSYIITSYINPDLDGVACMYAYSEFIKKFDYDASYYIEGNNTKEVDIVCDLFGIKLSPALEIKKDDSVILVDTNCPEIVSKKVEYSQVTEIIDHHRKCKENVKFTNANITLEELGAAATLITEKYKMYDITPSKEASILLYYGIISNTMNFHANQTKEKDKEMAKWLKEKCNDIDDNLINEIFIKKSNIESSIEELEKRMEISFVLRLIKDENCDRNNINENMIDRFSIGQLELANMNKILEERKNEIDEILDRLKKERKLSYICVNLIDILEGYSMIYCIDDASKIFLEGIMNVEFENINYHKFDSIIGRKEILGRINDRLIN